MAKSVTKNYIYDLVYRILQILTPLITAPYISRVIGSGGIGDYSATQAICSYFTLAAVLGSNVYGQREIAFCRDDREKRSKAFWEIMLIRIVTITICGIAYFGFAMFETGVIRVLLLLQMVDLWGLLFDITWLIQGVEEFGVMLARNLFIKAFSIICVFAFIRKKSDLYIYVLVLSLSVVLGNISLWPRLKKYVDFTSIKTLSFKRHFKPIFALFLPTIALRLHDSFDKTMLHYMVKNSDENGFYEQSRKIVTMSITIVTSLSNVMMPRMAALFSANDDKKLKEYLYNSFELIWTLAMPISFGVAAIACNLVPWYFGPGYEKVVILLELFAPFCVFLGLMNLIGLQYMVPTKRQHLYTISITVGLVLNIAVNAVMIPMWQSAGAVVASVLSEGAIVVVQLCMIRKEVTMRQVFKPLVWKVPATLLMAVVAYLIASKMPSNAINTFLAIAAGGILYAGTLIVLRDPSVKKVKELLMNKLAKKKA